MPFETPGPGLALLPLGPGFAAELRGLDLHQPQPLPMVEALHDALIAEGVLLLRGQSGGASALGRLAQQLAQVEQAALAQSPHQGAAPGIRARPLGPSVESWRSIGSAGPMPATLALASAASGRIAFADQQAAAAALPAALVDRIAGLRSLQMDPAAGGRAEHPLLRRHPLTGAALLAANPARTARVLNLPPGESTDLLARLQGAATDPAVVWTHAWAPGDVLIWDSRRVLYRGTVATRFVLDGDQPRPLPVADMAWVSAG